MAELFPEDDEWPKEIASLLPQESPTPLSCTPVADAGERLGPEEYEKLALSWCEHEALNPDQETREAIRLACEAYVGFLKLGNKIDSIWRNLHRLHFAVEAICQRQFALGNPYTTVDRSFQWLRSCWQVLPLPSEVDQVIRVLTSREFPRSTGDT